MCEPTTIVMAVGAVMAGYQAHQQGQATKAAHRYNARQMENEAIRMRNVGTQEENRHREAVAQLVAEQRVQTAAAGVDVDFGTAGALQDDTRRLGEADARQIRENYAYGAQGLQDQAQLSRMQGANAAKMGRNQLYGSLVTAGAGIASDPAVSSKWFSNDSAAVVATRTPFEYGGNSSNTLSSNFGWWST